MKIENFSKEIGIALHKNSNVTAITSSIIELTIDELLDDSLLKKIPIVKWIIHAKQIFTSISDRIFLSKMSAFLLQLSKSPAEHNEEYACFLDENSKERKRFNEMIFLLLHKLDATQKAPCLAEVSRMLLKGSITLTQFRKFCYAIDSIFVDDLLNLGKVVHVASNTTKIDRFRSIEQYGFVSIKESKVKIYSKSRDEMEQAYNVSLTTDGILLSQAIKKVTS